MPKNNSPCVGFSHNRRFVHFDYRSEQHWPWRSTVASIIRGGEGYCLTQQVSEQERKVLNGYLQGALGTEALKSYHNFLFGRKLLIRTDHHAMKWSMKLTNPDGLLTKWLHLLEAYDFKIEYRSGMEHGDSDASSRRLCGNCRHCDRVEQKESYASAENSEISSRTPPQPNLKTSTPKPSEPQGSSKPNQVYVAMGSKNDVRASNLADNDLRKIIAWEDS